MISKSSKIEDYCVKEKSSKLYVDLEKEEEIVVDNIDIGMNVEHKLESHFSKHSNNSSDALSDATEIRSLPDSRSQSHTRSISHSHKSVSIGKDNIL